MQKPFKRWLPWIILSGAGALGVGLLVALIEVAGWSPLRSPVTTSLAELGLPADTESPVLALAQRPVEERAQALAAIAEQGDPQERARAQYLLATDWIAQGRGGQAVPLLETVAADYPRLAAYSQVQLGIAQRASGDAAAAQQTWQTVVQTFEDHPAVAEALYQLGRQQPADWQTLLQQFPAHPRSVEVAYQRLANSSDAAEERALLLLMTRYGIEHPNVLSMVDRLVERYGDQLTPADWQAVGFAYWEHQVYGAAGEAYRRAPASPQTTYRAARGLQLGQRRATAIAQYETLINQFPDSPEAALGLLRLSDLVDETTALDLLDQVVERFPERAGEALLAKAELLTALNSPETAARVRDTILSAYGHSEAAATVRAEYARQAGAAGNWSGALRWADELLQHNHDATEIAAEIGFWAGKWALQAGQQQQAQSYFEQVIRNYPESYYAWRAAVALGWPVGTFQTLRSLSPEITLPQRRRPLPAGSDLLQELYLLGQDRDAWSVWQLEFDNRQTPSVDEQFTDGVLRLGVGDTLDGIFMVSSLSWRRQPHEQAAHAALRSHPAYWQTLYPFPFAEAITRWSAQRHLNPLLVTALIRQESRFQPKIRSWVGATGLMQVMPETAAWIQAQTGLPDYQLEDPDDNLELGTWYLDYTHTEYDNHSLFAVASYNAGPGNVADWIARQTSTDADRFVEQIPFPETKNYVKAVFGGYWNYLRLYNPDIAQRLRQTQSADSSSAQLSLYN